MDSYGFSGDMFSGRAVLGDDSSVMARMQKKFWKTKQVLIKATGKKEDEYVVASDADLDAKLEFFRSVQATCTELLKVVEKYQERITHLSQEENELGLFLRFQAEHDKTKAGNMMDATSKALCTSAKQRLALCAPAAPGAGDGDVSAAGHHGHPADGGAHGEVSHGVPGRPALDEGRVPGAGPRHVQAAGEVPQGTGHRCLNKNCARASLSRCNMLKNDGVPEGVPSPPGLGPATTYQVCPNMLSPLTIPLTTYQTTLLHFWEKTAHMMSGIHVAFQGYVPYQFTTLKELRDPLEQLAEGRAQEKSQESAAETRSDKLISLDEDKPGNSVSDAGSALGAEVQSRDSDGSLCASLDSALCELTGSLSALDTDDDLLLPDPPGVQSHQPPLPNALPEPEPTAPLLASLATDLLLDPPQQKQREEDEDGEMMMTKGDLSFLQDILSPGPSGSNEFSREWQDAFGCFEPPVAPPLAAAAAAGAPALSPSHPTGSSGFLPSQLLDQSLSSTGWATPPMFQAPPLQGPQAPDQAPPTQGAPKTTANAPSGPARDMSAWFNLFADLDPLSNPDAIGRSDDELLNA
ncbi:hypothetical protein ANANG_G00272980 [Anguilla anguilla]|uniref:AH domain-containing protein n=1 Tax=Anguilla anguilla TaxID=7936 RepID=A0A9D3LMV9_ANGAN|nr:hypothetical protein ANANG_G00272980 [Anguilla anguilla]